MLTSSALVLMMTIPGLFLFYGGLVRGKNVLGTIMQSFIIVALISIQWVLWGYTLAFGPDVGGIVGNLDWFGLNGVGTEPNADYAATIPHQTFMVYQMMFAVITPALITGAFAERVKFGAFLVFILLWATFIYDPLAHWVWGVKGWMREMGALDFAGGTVVHISSGASALVAALVFGRRIGYGQEAMPPHNLPFSVIGAALLWVGWFGFNAGSALAADGLATSAFRSHPRRDSSSSPFLDGDGLDFQRQTNRSGSRQRCRRWFGCDYSGLRICRSHLSNLDRHRWRCTLFDRL